MALRLTLLCLLVIFLPGQPANSQDARPQALDMRESGEAYLRAIRFRGIQSDVSYFDPTQPPPQFELNEPRPTDPIEQIPQPPSQGARTTVTAIAIALLLAIAALVLRYGGGMSISIGQNAANRSRSGTGADVRDGDEQAEQPASLKRIVQTQDRRLALVMLARWVLSRSVAQQGVIMLKSWTAREALRRLPAGAEHRAAVSDLVMASEGVLFGDRPVTEEDFTRHMNALKPLLRETEA